jgi:toxin ParE1/3/4
VRTVCFHDDARRELTDEALYYAAISPRLGERFVAAIEAATALAAQFPAIGSPYKHATRRVFPKKFRFSIVYVERGEDLYVLALAPFSRKPGYWKSRRSGA